MSEVFSLETEQKVKIGYSTEGNGDKVLLLIHGYPQTSLAWRHLIKPLTDAGFKLIIPDMRGAGRSSRPVDGYDKKTLASDMVSILNEQGITGPVYVAGHDIGMMVAFAMGAFFPEHVEKLVLMEAPVPGTGGFDAVNADDSRCWHFHFHQARDVPEALTRGNEAFYLERFFHDLAWDYQAIDPAAFEHYVRAFSQPGAMRAGFELYRAFARDAEDNKDFISKGQLKMPVLAATGEGSHFTKIMSGMMAEVAERWEHVVIGRSGHWIPEENPEELVAHMLTFLKA
jgi:pimeloyl-ACP methyl ester carboxylesterase